MRSHFGFQLSIYISIIFSLTSCSNNNTILVENFSDLESIIEDKDAVIKKLEQSVKKLKAKKSERK